MSLTNRRTHHDPPADLTEEARTGYYGNDNPHLPTSPCWYAHAFGRYLHQNGFPIPTADVRMSRGNSIRCGTARWTFKDMTFGAQGARMCKFERADV